MKTALKWFGILLAGLIGVLLLAYIAIFLISESRLNRVYEIDVMGKTWQGRLWKTIHWLLDLWHPI